MTLNFSLNLLQEDRNIDLSFFAGISAIDVDNMSRSSSTSPCSFPGSFSKGPVRFAISFSWLLANILLHLGCRMFSISAAMRDVLCMSEIFVSNLSSLWSSHLGTSHRIPMYYWLCEIAQYLVLPRFFIFSVVTKYLLGLFLVSCWTQEAGCTHLWNNLGSISNLLCKLKPKRID